MSEGIKRYKDIGGTRAITTTCRIDLRAPNRMLSDEEPFKLICGPQEAAERLDRLAELGFDDVCLRFVDHRERFGFATPSFSDRKCPPTAPGAARRTGARSGPVRRLDG
jgi:hypothetical protein